MNENCYKFVLWTCASSENEVTGEDIDIKNTFECDVDDIKNLKPGVALSLPLKTDGAIWSFPTSTLGSWKSMRTASDSSHRSCIRATVLSLTSPSTTLCAKTVSGSDVTSTLID